MVWVVNFLLGLDLRWVTGWVAVDCKVGHRGFMVADGGCGGRCCDRPRPSAFLGPSHTFRIV
jgi:hypothetical protein